MQNFSNKLKLDLACGNCKREGFSGVDIWEGADIVCDLTQYPWPFENNSVDEVFCSHYIEHVVDLVSFINELYRVMKVGATAEIYAPYYSSIRAWQDPTHVRAISENSFPYYNKKWRQWARLDHYPITADFDYECTFIFTPEWEHKTEEEISFAIKHYINAVSDIKAVLTKRAPDDTCLGEDNYIIQAEDDCSQQTVLNVGGNNKNIPLPDHYGGWRHILLDISPAGMPDIVADARDMLHLPPASFDAVYCAHNLEHYLLHEGTMVLNGFRHVLKSKGFCEISVPNVEELIQRVVKEGLDLDDILYMTHEGLPVQVHDVLYGFSIRMEKSKEDYYAHKCGFSSKSLLCFLLKNGFSHVAVRATGLEVKAYAFLEVPDDALLQLLQVSRDEIVSGVACLQELDELLEHAHESWESGDYAKAFEYCRDLLKFEKDSIEAYLLLGEIRLSSDNPEHASAYFRAALRLDPDSVQAHTGLMRALKNIPAQPELAEHVSKAKALFPELEELFDSIVNA